MAIHSQCLHQQGVAHAFVVKNLMWIVGLHLTATKIEFLAKVHKNQNNRCH